MFRRLIQLWLICCLLVPLGILLSVADNPYNDPGFAQSAEDMSVAQLTNQATQMLKDMRIGAWINITWDILITKGWGIPVFILFVLALLGAAYWGWKRAPGSITINY